MSDLDFVTLDEEYALLKSLLEILQTKDPKRAEKIYEAIKESMERWQFHTEIGIDF